MYLGKPTEEERAKVRDCLSFCLGSYLLYLGNTEFDSEWHPVAFEARSGHALVQDAPQLQHWQPSPLGVKWDREITSEVLGSMLSSLYKIYDVYDLQSSLWGYWHAIAAPVHMAAVHFGAAIESLQNTFMKYESGARNTIVEDKQSWENLCKELTACIESSDLPNSEKNLLRNKVNNLNFAPQMLVIERFFEALGLELGNLERRVWANRNRAAHGGSAKEDIASQLIRENKVLQIMMNRILIALSGESTSYYYDYYTLGRQIRSLADSIPDEGRVGA